MAEKKNKMLEDIDEITNWLEMRNAEISKGKTDVVETVERDTVIEELKQKNPDLLKAIYLLAFESYNGF